MASAAQMRTEHIAATPRGWKVRTVTRGAHALRIGFPPGRRKKGSGKVLEILHPAGERNPACIVSTQAKQNPGELLIFGNPARGPRDGNPQRLERNTSSSMRKRQTRERAAAIRAARLNSKIENRKSKPGKRNPEQIDEAVNLYESFHGKSPKEIVEVHASAAIRKDYTALGDLIAIGLDDGGFSPAKMVNRWEDCAHLKFDGAKLASAPHGRQLYVMGGKINLQSMLKNFEGDAEKDFVDLGEAAFVVYEARKASTKFEPVEWVHAFGEKGGARPSLMYDRLRRNIYFVGGDYFINAKDGPSPGIEN